MPPPDPVPAPSSPHACRVVLDVGTNSVKVLVGRIVGGAVEPLFEKGEQTRLGAGFFDTRRLQPDAIARTVDAARRLLAEADRFQPRSRRAIATAAAREAENAGDLRDAMRGVCGLDLEILSGPLEADLGFRGVCSDPALAGQDLLVADVGGGSTEFTVGCHGQRLFGRSYPMGAVRWFERLRLADPPGAGALEDARKGMDAFFRDAILPDLERACRGLDRARALRFVAVGGTAVILARMVRRTEGFDRDLIERTEIGAEALGTLTGDLWSLPLAERRTWPGLPPERADIILAGALIYEAILRNLGLPSMRPSTRGLRFALLLDDP